MHIRFFFVSVLGFSAVAAADLAPNELGKIPILTYHKISDEDTEYTRSRASFAKDLVELKRHGFYPVTLAELRSGRITTPKGKIPLLLTFDDSSESQFKYEADGSLTEGCGMEIMERFQKQNPDFPLRGVFFVLPKAQYPNNFFGQPEKIAAKLKYLTGKGFEIGSHTLWHANLKKYRNKIEEQLGLGTYEIQKYLKGYAVYAFALPYGIFPPKADEPRLRAGKYKGKSYKHDMIFDYSNALSYSVYDAKFDTYHIKRLHGNEATLKKLFKRATKEKHIFFVSDGNPETVTVKKADAERVRLKSGLKLLTY
ncbi:MAG: polysaccharide deacetylase family protein [Turneriella sp.]|nr:polysaccharide deacetylase family protein [Turneriella sp.]